MGWISTFSGKRIDPINPRTEDIDIIDIAHGLSNTCRFTGQCNTFYSVAQHSILVANFCSPENKLWGLLHDASEAYIADVSSPVKSEPEMESYRNIERRLQDVIAEKFKLSKREPLEVKHVDIKMLSTEERQLGLNSPESRVFEPFDIKIIPWVPYKAKEMFITMFYELWRNP